ncbi:helix-turn-helix domain-containing protein [Chroococcidiopsis sp. TS-821]|uniref:helix-turn-helix domain-containing protein n=1 Tax=Chroococcidiopsis sp. TS-821 TaxID=1378066 RepID=UPI000CEDA850|nr:helix-turn-helix domain-containing protein [Chroococcidiopsis sp. TS-821]PPS41230.1 transposase [Chroococcidiopsis sp. TS-821]
MPVKNFLKPQQKEQLQQALRESQCPYFRERVLMLLLMNDGKTYQEIADFIGCSYRTVAYWCTHSEPDNLDSMKDQRQNGNYRKATAEYIDRLMEVVQKKPSELGLPFENWSGERLATYLAQETGIDLTGAHVRKLLKKQREATPRKCCTR